MAAGNLADRDGRRRCWWRSTLGASLSIWYSLTSRGRPRRARPAARRERQAPADQRVLRGPPPEPARPDSPSPRTAPASWPSSPGSRTSAAAPKAASAARRRRAPADVRARRPREPRGQPRPARSTGSRPASATTSKLISSTPAIAPVRGIVTSGFGYRRDPITGQRAFHSGIDISAPPGKPVKSAATGVVVKTEEYGGLGRAVYVAHGYGITTVYGHLSRISVTPGQKVERGDVVGLVGNTGRSTGYHLHYEVQVEGKSVNPLAYMLDAGRRTTGSGAPARSRTIPPRPRQASSRTALGKNPRGRAWQERARMPNCAGRSGRLLARGRPDRRSPFPSERSGMFNQSCHARSSAASTSATSSGCSPGSRRSTRSSPAIQALSDEELRAKTARVPAPARRGQDARRPARPGLRGGPRGGPPRRSACGTSTCS